MVTLTAPAPVPAALGLQQAAVPLVPLRDELTLHPGPSTPAGAPTWTLHDPARGRYFRLGWAEAEILARWHLGHAPAVAEAVGRDTTLAVTVADVEAVARFLAANSLVRLQGPRAIDELVRQAAANRPSWAWWLLTNYLFFRVPLLRPDLFLAATLPWMAWIFTPGFLAAAVLAAMTGGWLASRQWDTFLATFPHFFSAEGLVLFAAAVALAKVLHEFAHAYTAKRMGCRVPSMGVAFMVLWPVLYTDVSDAWILTARRQRLAIGVAGIAAELALGAFALLAWSFLPNGPARSAAFVLASSSWIMTLTVNLSPLMRFDGYYLLTDLWEIPNLQNRAFALARWWLRERLFAFGEPPPEAFDPSTRRKLVAYAAVTWVYRFFLFLGIAVLVYHAVFKLLGLVLFAVEMVWFIARPIVAELAAWGRRRDRLRLNVNTLVTALLVGGLAVLLLVPWRSTVTAPALLRAAAEIGLFALRAGQVDRLPVRGTRVAAGEVVVRLRSPDLDYSLEQAARSVENLRGRAALMVGDREALERQRLAWQELAASQAELRGWERERSKLEIVAPFAGTVAEVAEPLAAGDWVAAGEELGRLVDPSGARLEAFVAEADLGRIAVGTQAWFYPENLDLPAVEAVVTGLDAASTRELADHELASVHEGGIAVRESADHELIPEIPVYRVRLDLVASPHPAPAQVVRGHAALVGERVSLATQVWRTAVGLVVRESGF